MVKYTESEIIVANAAKEIEDGDLVVIGQGIPMAAGSSRGPRTPHGASS
jgi:acyl CoA:acetate/3-ketoacid CoA transferase beta subunit